MGVSRSPILRLAITGSGRLYSDDAARLIALCILASYALVYVPLTSQLPSTTQGRRLVSMTLCHVRCDASVFQLKWNQHRRVIWHSTLMLFTILFLAWQGNVSSLSTHHICSYVLHGLLIPKTKLRDPLRRSYRFARSHN